MDQGIVVNRNFAIHDSAAGKMIGFAPLRTFFEMTLSL